LARQSDVLVLTASADQGAAIITSKVLKALGPDGYLINVARGKLVDVRLSNRAPSLASSVFIKWLRLNADKPSSSAALRKLLWETISASART
jgi:hypothetical protein